MPTLAADEPGFNPAGGYWNGAVWAPTNRMIVEGLENYGYGQLARRIAMNHLHNIVVIFNETGTLWENYAPENIAPGKPSKGDFVGWTGIGPIAFFIEYAIGIRADAVANKITWEIHSPKRVGIEKFWFGGKTVSLICEQANSSGIRLVTIKSDGGFNLTVKSSGKTKTILVPTAQKIQLSI